jgi:mRNA interferase HicA
MKRGALIRHIEDNGCVFEKEASRHTLYRNPSNGQRSTVPRHPKIKDNLAIKICKDLGIPKP